MGLINVHNILNIFTFNGFVLNKLYTYDNDNARSSETCETEVVLIRSPLLWYIQGETRSTLAYLASDFIGALET